MNHKKLYQKCEKIHYDSIPPIVPPQTVARNAGIIIFVLPKNSLVTMKEINIKTIKYVIPVIAPHIYFLCCFILPAINPEIAFDIVYIAKTPIIIFSSAI